MCVRVVSFGGVGRSWEVFGGAHRGKICVSVFIEVSVRVSCERIRCTL